MSLRTIGTRVSSCLRVCVALLAAAAIPLAATSALAQMPNPYGAPISADVAKRVAAAGLAEAKKNGWTQAVAIVDIAGDLVYFEKMDGTQGASIDIAIDKARASARFKRPTKALQDALAAGGEGWRFLTLRGVVAAEGGVPILLDGKIVGALGVSGGTGPQDGQVANAAIAASK